MAYATKYLLPFASQYNVGNVYLKKEGYLGAVKTLRMKDDGLELESTFDGWFNPVLKQKAFITFINNADNFFEYSDLFELEERDFQVIIEIEKDSGVLTVFDGWLNSETIQQKYLKNSQVQLTATNYVSKLKYHFDNEINTIQERSIINFITQALLGTAKEDTIALNCHLFPVGYEANSITRSGFTKGGLFTEMFWKNNIERMDSLAVIETILKAFDCYLYWWDGKWWIERYREMYAASIDYYPYEVSPSDSYGYDSDVTQETRVNNIIDIKDLNLTNMSQTLSAIPGYNKFEVFLNQRFFLNLVFNDFTNREEYTSAADPNPDFREWEYYDGNVYNPIGLGYKDWGAPFINIGNSCRRTSWEVDPGALGTIQYYEYHRGICTKFRMTVANQTNLNISWKSTFLCGAMGGDACSEPETYQFYFYYYLRIAGTNDYIYYENSTNEWIVVETASEKTACNRIAVSGVAAFKDNTYLCEPKVTIPMSDIVKKITLPGLVETAHSLEGDQDIIFMIGLCIGVDSDAPSNPGAPPLGEFIGDAVVTADNELQDNLLTGILNNNVLKSERIEVDLFDSANWNYVNTIITDTLYDKRTSTWVEDEDSSSPDYKLSKWNLISKFQLYNRNRKQIQTSFISNEAFHPFALFKDGNDSNRKYVLGTYRWKIVQGTYDATFLEYDTTDEINFI